MGALGSTILPQLKKKHRNVVRQLVAPIKAINQLQCLTKMQSRQSESKNEYENENEEQKQKQKPKAIVKSKIHPIKLIQWKWTAIRYKSAIE